MCQYCDNPEREDAIPAYDVNSGSEAILYQDPVSEAWWFKVTDEDGENTTKICVANCPWCGCQLD